MFALKLTELGKEEVSPEPTIGLSTIHAELIVCVVPSCNLTKAEMVWLLFESEVVSNGDPISYGA